MLPRFARRAFRTAFAVSLAFLLGMLPSLAGSARAQTAGTPSKASFVAVEEAPAYVIYESPEGEITCREATPTESISIRGASPLPLRPINHLKGAAYETQGAGLTIVLRGTAQLDANPAAKQAFVNAAAKWEAVIADPVTVYIDVDYGSTFFGTAFSSSNTLGATGSSGYLISYSSLRQRLASHAPPGSEEFAVVNTLPLTSLPTDIGSVSSVFVVPPIMRALGFLPASPAQDTQTISVPKIGFNSAFGFDFDPNDGVSTGLTDFDSVAVHEIGHALGFNSMAGDKELRPDAQLLASVWDLYRFKPSAASLPTFSVATRTLSSGTTSTDRRVQFNGDAEIELSTGKPDGTGGDGNQSSHWKDDSQGVPFIGIMDPTLRRGVHYQITANDLRALNFIGYGVGQVTAPTPPANDNFSAAQQLAGNTGRVTGTNSGATKETGEPSHSPDGNAGGKSVWYRWQAPANGTAVFTTGTSSQGASSNFDTLLAAYNGSTVAALSAVGKNDDVSTSDPTSTLQFNAAAGTVYQIAVDGYNADEGSLALAWSFTPTQAPGGTVQFASSSVVVSEAGGSATLIVARSGDTSQTVTVNARTVDNTAAVGCADTTTLPGVAFARCDYATTVDTLTFAPGETQKQISVPVIDDAHVEPNENVQVTLSNLTGGATFGSASNAVVTIVSNDAPGQTNPIRLGDAYGNSFFVRQHYLDFLSREPEAGEPWSGTLSGCSNQFNTDPNSPARACDRISVSISIFASAEFQLKGASVFRFYKLSFGRMPSYDEIIPDMRGITGSSAAELYAKKAAFADAWVRRQEFVNAYPMTDNSQFVDALLGRYGLQSITTNDPATPDTGPKVTLTRADLAARLNASTLTRAQVVRAAAESDQVAGAERDSAFVAMQYYGYLRRTPEPGGYAAWLNHLSNNPGDYRSRVNGFLNSPEYRLRFGASN